MTRSVMSMSLVNTPPMLPLSSRTALYENAKLHSSRVALTVEREHLVCQRADRMAVRVDAIEAWPDEFPGFRQDLATTATQRARVLVADDDAI
jgi:hypothetical protein